MRFSRDKRGYEHTFVVHGEGRRGRSRTRVLYWFRTPPGVKVGRAPLDTEAIQLIEAHNPDVAFDWPRILKGEGVTAETRARPEPQERRPRQDRARPERQPGPRPRPQTPATRPDPVPAESTQPRPEPEAELAQPSSAEAPLAPAEDAVPETAPDTPAGRRLGAEGLGRLRARYAEVIARIVEKVSDPAGQGELNIQAERLNPDAWVTDDEVAAGLEEYEAVYEALRSVVGRRRPRRNQPPSV